MIRFDKNRARFYSPPITQYFYAIIVSLSHLIYGLSVTWSSSFINELEKPDSTIHISSSEQLWTINIITLGSALAAILVALFGNKIGRKSTLLMTTLMSMLSNFAFIFITDNGVLLCVARLALGLFLEWMCSIAIIYTGETTSPCIRGKLLIFNSIQLTAGLFLGFMLSGYVSYFCYNVIFSVLCAIFLLLTVLYIIESPYYLILKNESTKAEINLMKIKLTNNIKDDLNSIQLLISEQREVRIKFVELFTKKNVRLAILLSIAFQFANNLTGIDIFSTYLFVLVKETQIDAIISPVHVAMIFSACGFLSVTMSTVFIDKYGRKPLLFVSTCLTSLFLFIFGFYVFLSRINFVYLHQIRYLAPICLFLYKVSMGIGLTSLLRVCIGELFPTKFAPIGACIARTVYNLNIFAILEVYPVLSDNFGLDGMFMGLALICFIFGTSLTFLTIETNNKTLEEVQRSLKNYRVFRKAKKNDNHATSEEI